MRRWRIARLVAGKDLRIERRSRVVVNQVLPFAAVTMLMFAFALDATNVLERVAPGLVWLATLFSLLVLVQRAFAIEADDGALDALRVAGVDPVAIYWGKSMALAAQLAVLELLLLVAAVLLYGADVPAGGLALLAVTLVLATAGSGMRRYAVRRPHRRVHRSRDIAPVARAPGGGARPDRSNPSRRIRARHRWGGALGGLAVGRPARRVRRRLRRRRGLGVRTPDRGSYVSIR